MCEGQGTKVCSFLVPCRTRGSSSGHEDCIHSKFFPAGGISKVSGNASIDQAQGGPYPKSVLGRYVVVIGQVGSMGFTQASRPMHVKGN